MSHWHWHWQHYESKRRWADQFVDVPVLETIFASDPPPVCYSPPMATIDRRNKTIRSGDTVSDISALLLLSQRLLHYPDFLDSLEPGDEAAPWSGVTLDENRFLCWAGICIGPRDDFAQWVESVAKAAEWSHERA